MPLIDPNETPEEQIARYRETLAKVKRYVEEHTEWARYYRTRDPRMSAFHEKMAKEEEDSARQYRNAIEAVGQRIA